MTDAFLHITVHVESTVRGNPDDFRDAERVLREELAREFAADAEDTDVDIDVTVDKFVKDDDEGEQ